MDVRSTLLSRPLFFFLLARLASRSWPPRFFSRRASRKPTKKPEFAAAWAFFFEVVVGGSILRRFS